MDDTRRAILRWMTGVMEARGWSAGGWARLADVTATNLTRFLRDPVMGSVPSADTLARLAPPARNRAFSTMTPMHRSRACRC